MLLPTPLPTGNISAQRKPALSSDFMPPSVRVLSGEAAAL
jgi:hypothetical protein